MTSTAAPIATRTTSVHYLKLTTGLSALATDHGLDIYPEPCAELGHWVEGTRDQVLEFHKAAGLDVSVGITTRNAY